MNSQQTIVRKAVLISVLAVQLLSIGCSQFQDLDRFDQKRLPIEDWWAIADDPRLSEEDRMQLYSKPMSRVVHSHTIDDEAEAFVDRAEESMFDCICDEEE